MADKVIPAAFFARADLADHAVLPKLDTSSSPALNAADTYFFANSGRVWVMIQRSGNASTVTFQTRMLIDGDLTVEDRVIVAAGPGKNLVGPFSPAVYNDGEGRASFSVTAARNVDIYLLET